LNIIINISYNYNYSNYIINMKTFNRSKTSQRINFSKNKSNRGFYSNKNLDHYDQKYEENIERIVSYIKQHLRDSNLKKEQKDNNNIQTENTSNPLDIDYSIFDFGTIKYILNKTGRNADEILLIKTYLSSMSFLSTLKSPISNDKLLYSLSLYLKMENKSKDELIFRYGNKGNKFFIVLEGEISILILKETKALISFKRYFLHLLLLKILKEDELVKKTIMANSKMNYHFDDKDFDEYYEKIVNFASKNFNKNNKISDLIDNDNDDDDDENKDNIENENEKNKEIDNDLFIDKKRFANRNKSISLTHENSLGIFKFFQGKKKENEESAEKEKTINNNKEIKKDRKKGSIIKKGNKSKNEKKSVNFKEEEKKIDIDKVEKENEDKNSNAKEKNKMRSKGKISSRLNQKRNTMKFFDPRNILSSILRKNEEMNYNHINLPYFEIYEIREIILYYVYLKETVNASKKNVTMQDYIQNTYLSSPYHKMLSNEQYNKKELFIIFQYFEIAKKKVGESFGELSLQREDNKRTGSAITTKECILGYLSRADYNAYLGEIEVKRRKNDINFVMSFSIFDNMNKNVFENRYFNFFTKETFFQGQKIINQEQKINKIYFIMEGQFEITTNLSMAKIYSILQSKTQKKIDDRKKIRIKKKNFNMRLYISYNKDILGLDDCCYDNNISFINAKCISSQGSAFSIEKSILDEIKYKINEIDENIKIIIENRQQVMIDRLINIYNRIVQTNTNNKNNKLSKNKKNNSKDSFKYINYLFGINQNQKNNNFNFKTLTATKNKNFGSKFYSKDEKIIIDHKFSSIDNNKMSPNKNYINNYLYEKSKTSKKSINKNFRCSSSKTIYVLKNNNTLYRKEDQNLEKNEINEKNTLSRNNSQQFLVINKNFFPNNKKEFKSIQYDTKESMTINNNINNENDNESKNEKEDELTIKNKISEIMTNKEGIYKTRDKKLVLKMSKKLNRVRNNHTRRKFIGLYNPINQIISKEYSNLFNWIDTHQSENAQESNKELKLDNKLALKSDLSSKLFLSNKSNNKNNIVTNNMSNNISSKKRPLSSNLSKNKIFLKNENESNMSNIFNSNDKPDFYNKSGNDTPHKFNKNKKNKYDKKVLSAIILGQKNIPHNIEKNIDIEKYLKQILGCRYRDQFVSYEEQKLRKFIDRYNIHNDFLNKGKINRLNKHNSQTNCIISYSTKYNRPMSAQIKFNTKLLKK